MCSSSGTRAFWGAQSSASEAAVLPTGKLRQSHICLSFRGGIGRITPSLNCCWLTSGCFVLLPTPQSSPRPQLAGWVKSSGRSSVFRAALGIRSSLVTLAQYLLINKSIRLCIWIGPFLWQISKQFLKKGKRYYLHYGARLYDMLAVGDWARSWLYSEQQLLSLVKCHTPAVPKVVRSWPSTRSPLARWARASTGKLIPLPSHFLR